MLLRSLTIFVVAGTVFGQSNADLAKLVDRLDRLEKQNKDLSDQVQTLRDELAALKGLPAAGETATPVAAGATVGERLDVQESRIAELSQTKVESSQRVPISLTGMLLFNAFINGKNGGTLQYPLTAALTPGTRNSGASLRQTVLGLKFDGPTLIGGGKASGNIYMDFFAGSAEPNNNLLRLRVATLDLAWKNTTVTVGQDKPIFAPREPTSIAQVGISPLTSAGNLWDWRPQARVEQRFIFAKSSTVETGLKVQAGLYMTYENDINLPAAVANTLEKWRPALEGRVELYHHRGERKFEIAPGFHFSTTHVSGASVPSKIGSLDWLLQPERHLAFTGAWFTGENVANTGALRQGFVVTAPRAAAAIHSYGGWGQVAVFLTPRLTWDVYGGQQRDRATDLGTNFFANGGVTRNFTYATNFIYRLAPNILASFEAAQMRTSYRTSGNRLNNHYDLSLAYLF